MEDVVISHRSSIELLDTALEHRLDRGDDRVMPRLTADGRELRFDESLASFEAPRRRTSRWHLLERWAHGGGAGISLPIDTLAPNALGRRGSSLVRPHGHRRRLHADDVIPIDGRHLFATIPELTFVMLSARSDLYEAIELGMQLTGTYRRLTPKEAPTYAARAGSSMDYFPRGSTAETCKRACAYNVRPLTTVGRLRGYIERAAGTYGAAPAGRALAYVREGLRSPLEAELFLRCFLPRELGGLGLREPVINRPLTLGDRAARLAGKSVIVPDFLWPEERVVVEALGRRDHGGSDGITETSRREKAYRAQGITCLTITAAEVRDARELEAFARELSHFLGDPFPALDAGAQERVRMAGARIRRLFGDPGCRPDSSQTWDDDHDAGWFAALSQEIDTYGSW